MRTLEQAFDSGITFYDTADSYGLGHSEELLGRVFRGKRSAIIIATKAGYRVAQVGSLLSTLKPLVRPALQAVPWLRKSALKVRSSQLHQDFSPGYLRAAVDRSLARLRTDYIDLMQIHNPPALVARDSAVFEMLDSLRRQGKIRHYGVSFKEPEEAAEFLTVPGLASLQFSVNILNWQRAAIVAEQAQSRNLAVIANQPLAGGPDILAKAAADRLASGCRTIAQGAVQFTLQVPGISVAIPGMTNRNHLVENLGALTAPRLSPQELAAIRGSEIRAAG